jgi:hypothetical protein
LTFWSNVQIHKMKNSIKYYLISLIAVFIISLPAKAQTKKLPKTQKSPLETRKNAEENLSKEEKREKERKKRAETAKKKTQERIEKKSSRKKHFRLFRKRGENPKVNQPIKNKKRDHSITLVNQKLQESTIINYPLQNIELSELLMTSLTIFLHPST